MPQALTYVFAYAASSAGISVGSTALIAAGYAATAALTVGIGNHQRRKAQQAARAAFNASLQDRLVMTSLVSGPRSRIYGRVRNVDGILFKATRGTNNEFYTLVVALAGHEVDAIEDVYFGDQVVTLDGSGYVQTTPFAIERRTSRTAGITLNGSGGGTATITGTYVSGSASAVQPATESTDETALQVSVVGSTITVSGGTAGASAIVNWQTSALESKARVRKYLGAASQDLSSVLAPLFPSLITSAHKFAGTACLIVDLEYDPDAWPSGVPSISAVVRGARVLDPRTSTTAWTQNPALIARDWALHANGGACVAADLAAASFTAAANACDVTHGFVTPSGTSTLPIYTCNIALRTDADPSEGLAEIVESMAGKAGWAGGQLRIVAGVSRAAVATITEDWLTDEEDIQIVPEPPAEEAVNVYRPTIADKDQGYTAVPSPEVRSSTYIAADGRELAREITLGAVTDAIHAQHVCGVLMRDARNALTVTLSCNLRAYQLELFDVVEVTLARFGWSAKTFEVVDWQFSLAGGVTLTLKETAAAIFQPDAGFAELDLTPNTELPDPAFAPIPTGVTVSTSVPELVDGQPVVRALVEWDALADAAVLQGGSVEIQYLEIGSNYGWLSVKVAGDQTEHVLPVLQAGSSYLFRTRSINAIGVHSDWSVQTVIVTSAAPKIQASGLAVGAVSARVEAEKAVKLTAFAAGIEPVTVVAGSTLPTTKSTETIVLTGTGKLYRWTGSAYTAAVPTSDLSGTISEAQIAANAVSVAKFASGIEPVTVVSSVPGSLSTRSIFNTSDGKLYRWNGSAYVATVPTTDLTGTVSDAQIAGMAASKISGQLSDSQLAAIAAAKVTGTLNASQLAVSIGGGNLLPNANFKKHAGGFPYGWTEYNNGGTARTFQVASGGLFGTNFVRVTADAATTNTLGISTQTGVAGGGVQAWQPGLTYIVSFYARSAGSLAAGKKMQGLYSNMGFPSATELASPALINGTWQRYVWRVSPADNAQTPAGELYLSWDVSGTLPSGAAIDICAVQVEQGDMVTAFAPKPSEILPDTITATEIADNAITTPKLVAGAVVAGKIAANAVSATEIAAGAVTTAKLAAGAVTANEIAANTITAAKIATGTITATELAAGSVTTAKIAAGAVTATEIAAATITGGKIAAGTITGSNIAADTITAGQIAAGAITADEIAAGSVIAAKLAAGAVTTSKLLVAPVSLCPDPFFTDEAWWTTTSFQYWLFEGYPPYMNVPKHVTLWSGSATPPGTARGHVWSAPVACPAPGTVVRLRARMWNGSNQPIYTQCSFANGAGTGIDGFRLTAAAGAGVQDYSAQFTVPPNSATMTFIVYNEGGTTFTGFAMSSAVMLDIAASAELIVDGAITTDKLTANAVTAAKITAGAVTTAKLAAGAVTANEIAANTITAAKIAAGAIGADQIAANAIRTQHLLVTGPGSLLPDGTFEDQENWGITYGGTKLLFKAVSDAPAGRYVAYCPAGSIQQHVAWLPGGNLLKTIPVDLTRRYRFSFYYRVVGSASGANAYATVAQIDSAGNRIGNNGGHEWYGWQLAATAPGAWTRVEFMFGQGATYTLNAACRFVTPSFLLNWENAGGEVQIADVRIVPQVDASLIVDGAITAAKISVTNLAAVNAQTGALTVDGTLTVGTGGKVQSGKTAYGSGTGWLIEHNGGTPRFDVGDGTKYIRWTGSNLEIGGQVVTNSNLAGSISADKLSLGTITVTFNPTSVTETVYNANETAYASVTASASGGTGTYTYRFTIESYNAEYTGNTRPAAMYVSIDNITTGDTVNPKGAQPNNTGQDFDIVCVATDANGRTGTGRVTYAITHGTRP